MNLKQIASGTTPLNIPYASPISSKDLNDFSQIVTQDINSLTTLMNVVIKILNGLLVNDVDTTALDYTTFPGISAENILFNLNNSSFISSYFAGKTINEVIISMFQIMANLDSGAKYGIKYNNETFEANQSKTYRMTSNSDMFLYRVFQQDISGITDVSELFSVKKNGSSIILTNKTNNAMTVNFIVWQPNFIF